MRLAEVRERDEIIEIGPGFGSLTLALAEVASHVVAIEFDRRLVQALKEVVADRPNVVVLHRDAMDANYEEITQGRPHRLISNLPYNISTPLIAGLLSERPEIEDFFIMIQKEVGERLVAGPGSKTYGAVSVLVRYHCDARLVGRVSPNAFWPVPGVDSVLIRLIRRDPPIEVEERVLMDVVRRAFSQRRKKARNVLEATEEQFERAGVDLSARAEDLSLEDFGRLAMALEDRR